MCCGGDAITVVIPAADRARLEPSLKHAAAAAAHARTQRHAASILVVDYEGAAATDWVGEAFPEVYRWSSQSPRPRERAVGAAMQWARSQLLSSAILALEAPALIPVELLTDLDRTIHAVTRLGLIRLRSSEGEEREEAAVPERGALALAMCARPPGVLELLREPPAEGVVLRGDMFERIGGLDAAHTTGLAVADLVRRAHLDGWTTAWHTAPGLRDDHAPPGTGWRRIRDELDLIACDPALTWAGAGVAARAWLGRPGQEPRHGAVSALAALAARLPRLVRRRRQHRAIALADALHEGRLAPPRGWHPPRPCSIGWEQRA